ncbi:hypothetical protein [Micromonospora aurantiaca (nom. illeg.)]|uniref:hypothetical protein n=1 Tax=Micromonospora aurantiaca (nom. illeg.) TaxID=47850 RepID=UPI003665D859
MRIVRAKLEGVDAEPGRVAAADVARMILGLERAIARAAYLVLGKARRGTGRHSQAIESAARLRFVGVEPGSFVELLALPEAAEPTDEELPISVADLSSLAFERLLTVITSGAPDTDAELAAAVAQLATELGIGDRNTAITLIDDFRTQAGQEPRHATIDAAVRERMQRLSEQPPASRDETLVGVLFEADFEGNSARLRLASGGVVTVNFLPELADDIQEALRSRARLEGHVRYHPRTAQATSVELRAVSRSTQLELDVDSFWESQSFAELQAAQGTTGRVDAAALGMTDLTNDERAAFLAALAE